MCPTLQFIKHKGKDEELFISKTILQTGLIKDIRFIHFDAEELFIAKSRESDNKG